MFPMEESYVFRKGQTRASHRPNIDCTGGATCIPQRCQRAAMTNPRESVAAILDRSVDAMIHDWMELVEHDEEITSVPLNRDGRTVHLHKFFHDLLVRLRLPRGSKASTSRSGEH